MENYYFYLTNLRFEIVDKIYLSNYFKIYLRNLKDNEIAYFLQKMLKKYKSLLITYKLEEIFEKCKIIRDSISQSFIKKSLGSFTLEDYFILFDFREIIDKYNAENREEGYVIKKEDLELSRIQEYLYKYYEKFIVIDFESTEELLKRLANYNDSKEDNDDKIMMFRTQFINFYNYINNTNITCKVYSLNDQWEIHEGIHVTLLSKIPRGRFYKSNSKGLIDKFLLSNNENFYYFMFILEVFYHSTNNSDKKTIIDYVTMIEMFLTHSPSTNRYNVEDSISKQFIEKLSACLVIGNSIKNEGALSEIKKELKYIYNYRSKLLHGEYFEMNKQLKSFLGLSYYKNKCSKDIDRDYYTSYSLVEKYISIRIKEMFRKVFDLKVKNNVFIEALK